VDSYECSGSGNLQKGEDTGTAADSSLGTPVAYRVVAGAVTSEQDTALAANFICISLDGATATYEELYRCSLDQLAPNAYTAGNFKVTFPIVSAGNLVNLPEDQQPSLSIYIHVQATAT